jgi:phytoene dehydrogenase-like protein
VTVLEAADTLGGGTRSSEPTLPGLIHDECSAAHPLAVDTAFIRRFDLGAHGLSWRWPEIQYTHPLDGGTGAAAYRSIEQTAAALGGDGRRWQSLFGPLAARFDDITADFLRPMAHVPEYPLALARFGALDPYATGIPGVYLCSAATPPGAGAHGMCGYNAANSTLRAVRPSAPATVAVYSSGGGSI